MPRLPFIWADIVDGRKGPVELGRHDADDPRALVTWLLERARREPSRALGCRADWLLGTGGSRPLLWIDADTRDPILVMRLTDTLPAGSFAVTRSSSGRHHVYVVTQRALGPIECAGLLANMRRDPADPRVGGCIDRIYGPRCRMPIYLPRDASGTPRLPQDLCAGLAAWDPIIA